MRCIYLGGIKDKIYITKNISIMDDKIPHAINYVGVFPNHPIQDGFVIEVPLGSHHDLDDDYSDLSSLLASLGFFPEVVKNAIEWIKDQKVSYVELDMFSQYGQAYDHKNKPYPELFYSYPRFQMGCSKEETKIMKDMIKDGIKKKHYIKIRKKRKKK